MYNKWLKPYISDGSCSDSTYNSTRMAGAWVGISCNLCSRDQMENKTKLNWKITQWFLSWSGSLTITFKTKPRWYLRSNILSWRVSSECFSLHLWSELGLLVLPIHLYLADLWKPHNFELFVGLNHCFRLPPRDQETCLFSCYIVTKLYNTLPIQLPWPSSPWAMSTNKWRISD